MIAYHLDRLGNLEVGQTLQLRKPDFHNNQVFKQSIELYGLDHVSRWGMQFSEWMKYPNAISNQEQLDIFNIESLAESVRHTTYPHAPSRFKSLFAVRKLSDFEFWEEHFKNNNKNYSIYEIEYNSDNAMEFDARFLDSVARVDFLTRFEMLSRYWTGEISASPLPELLIPLPVTVVGKVL